MKRLGQDVGGRARAVMAQLAQLLTEGAVSQETLLDNVPRILAVVRRVGQTGTNWDWLRQTGTEWDGTGQTRIDWYRIGRNGTDWDRLG